jgi:peroxiredoxin
MMDSIPTTRTTALHVYHKVPLFYLPAAKGGQSGPAATRSKYNLVLVFLESGPEGEAYLQALTDIYPAILKDDARAIVVMQATLEETQRIASKLDLPFALLADDGGATTQRMLDEGNHAGLCIADRYGIIYYSEAVAKTASLPPASVIPEWLQYIEIQCPECTDGSDQIWLTADSAE